jgi:hypothetical protein
MHIPFTTLFLYNHLFITICITLFIYYYSICLHDTVVEGFKIFWGNGSIVDYIDLQVPILTSFYLPFMIYTLLFRKRVHNIY